MKYMGMPSVMWALYKNSFRDNLTVCLGISPENSGRIMKRAGSEYRKIINKLPETCCDRQTNFGADMQLRCSGR